MKYYILINDKTAGPYSLEQVRVLYNVGSITQDHMYATTESQDWMPVSMLVPLFGIPTPPFLPQQDHPSIVINNSNNTNSGNVGTPIIGGIVGVSRTNRLTYQLLALFLGGLGIHNFYAGHNNKGMAQLLITVLTCGYGGIISWIWAIVEIFVIREDGHHLPMI